MKRAGCIVAAFAALVLLVAVFLPANLFGSASISQETDFVIPAGSSLTAVAHKLEQEGLISSADGFLLRARLLGAGAPIHAGDFLLTPDMDQHDILAAFQEGKVVRRFVTIPEGMPSIMVHERLMAQELLTGKVAVPAEGSILPDTYDFERGESRQEVLARMQAAMSEYLTQAWKARGNQAVVESPQEALILASIVEKETARASERRMVAGVLSNRLRIGMRLGADATTIYPITRGKPLGRLIRQSELRDPNPYNTRAIGGLPAGPITNPGRESIAAVLNPARTKALYYVADGSGGHAFASTLEEHNANVARWRAIRRERGEI